jgi:tRNA G18 (ribose-2'-O)-methylase SpoU
LQIPYSVIEDTNDAIESLLKEKYALIALEITSSSIPIQQISVPKNQKVALIIGNEIEGISEALLAISNQITHITMYGKNSSMNVVQATSIALYEISNQLNEI